MNKQFTKDIKAGLSSSPKTLPSKYFYDKIGDKLFQEIMQLPEYYLTRSEDEIFSEKSEDVIDILALNKNESIKILELGAGDGTKTVKFLSRLLKKNYNIEYNPLDISQNALNGLKQRLEHQLPDLKIKPIQGDYFHSLQNLTNSNSIKVILFLGSNMGNMTDDQAIHFLNLLADTLNKGDKLLLGLDQIKPSNIVLPAYNDALGVTSRFNLNLLTRINNELGGNFKLENWSHEPTYCEISGKAESFIRSNVDQSVYIKSMDETFNFSAGELIQTEISRKYNDTILHNILSKSKLKLIGKVFDSKKYFANYIIEKNEE